MYKIIIGGLVGLFLTSCVENTPSHNSRDKNLEICRYLTNEYRDPNKILSRKTLNVCKKVNSIIGEGYVAQALYSLDRKDKAKSIYNRINPTLEKKCLNNNTDACNILSSYYFNQKNSKKVVIFSKKSCDLKNGIGCNNLGYIYSRGIGVKKDERKASLLFEKACNFSETLGCTNLGLNYQYGKGVEKKPEKSLLLYKEACDSDDGQGCSLLGYMYQKGEGFMKKDEKKALSLYQKACELNSGNGCKNTGVMYAKGKGTKKDDSKAAYYYTKSCKLDNDISCKLMGDKYKIGKGVPKNKSKSKEFYEKACMLENGQACDILNPNRNKNRFKELLVIIGDEDKQHTFKPAKDILKPFIEVENGLVGDICLKSAIVANAFMNFEKKLKEKNKSIKNQYYADILMIRNKGEVAVVFKTKINGEKGKFRDELPIIRYDKKDSDKIFDAVILKLKEELKVDDKGIKTNKVSREILNLLFPKRFYEYMKNN